MPARSSSRPSARFRLNPPRPYSLSLTVERLVRFSEVVDRFEDGVYRRLLWLGGAGLLVSVRQRGPASRAELEIRLDGRPASSHSLPLREDPRILQEFAIELDPESAGDGDEIRIEIEGEYISLAYWFYARDSEPRRDREP